MQSFCLQEVVSVSFPHSGQVGHVGGAKTNNFAKQALQRPSKQTLQPPNTVKLSSMKMDISEHLVKILKKTSCSDMVLTSTRRASYFVGTEVRHALRETASYGYDGLRHYNRHAESGHCSRRYCGCHREVARGRCYCSVERDDMGEDGRITTTTIMFKLTVSKMC